MCRSFLITLSVTSLFCAFWEHDFVFDQPDKGGFWVGQLARDSHLRWRLQDYFCKDDQPMPEDVKKEVKKNDKDPQPGWNDYPG